MFGTCYLGNLVLLDHSFEAPALGAFFFVSAVKDGFTVLYLLSCSWVPGSASECPEPCHWLAEGPQFSHQQHPLSQKHCASFLCVHNLEMEDKVFILKDCLSSCCWWFLIRPLSKLVFFPKWCMSKALFKLCLVLKSAQTSNHSFRMSGP